MNLSEILYAIDGQIEKLQQARELINASASAPSFSVHKSRRGRPPGAGKPANAKLTGKRMMSEAGRARIVAAQKKRWAKIKSAARPA